MNTFNRILLVMGFLVILASCRKDRYQLYQETQNNVYFDFASQADRDSVTYTFAYTPGLLTDTLYLPIRISGNRASKPLTYKVVVTDSGTTAKPGLDYLPFKDSYTVPDSAGSASLPVILVNKDTNLTQHSVGLNLHLVATSDLGVQLSDIIRARVIISNKLEKPYWWDTWLTNYSDEKYLLYIVGSGGTHDLPTGDGYGQYAPQALYYIGLMNNLINDPFGWVAKNPDKGYVLDPQPDGSWYFYNTTTPTTRIKVIFDSSASRYYFVQKIGGFVTPY